MKLCKSKAITIYDYRDVDLSQYAEPFSMSDEELAEKLDKVRTRHAAMAEAETVERDDFVTLDTASDLPKFQKTGITVRVGKGLYSRELEEAILGMKTGEARNVTIPDGDVKVTIRTTRRRVLPPLDDETVAAWGLDGVETVDQLTAQIRSEAKAQYVSDMAEALAVEVSGAANDRSTFDLDEEELRAVEAEGQVMAEDMLRSAGLDPDAATDEEVMAVSGRTKAEHYDFMRTLCRQELRSVAIGAELMDREGVEIPDGAYDEAVQQCADGMGISRQEAEKVITYPKFLRQFAANYYFEKIIDHVTGYLNEEEEQ
jgi:FKBP-type peptidyl-prolyl cis-trans isomerase (trigger factor)